MFTCVQWNPSIPTHVLNEDTSVFRTLKHTFSVPRKDSENMFLDFGPNCLEQRVQWSVS